MTVFPYVTGVGAIAADLVLFHRAFPPMLASVRPGTRIDELAIVQRYFSHNSVGVHHVSRLYSLVVHPYLAHTPDQTYPKIKYISLSRCITRDLWEKLTRVVLSTSYDDFVAQLERHRE